MSVRKKPSMPAWCITAGMLILTGAHAGPASASGMQIGQNTAGFAAGLLQLPMPPGTPEWLKNGAEWWDNYQRAWTLMHNLEPCAASGIGSSDCSDAVWAGACTMYLELGVELAPELRILGIPFDAICSGEPTLKCCKYDPATQNACHTAFNSDHPINCEGNESAPNAESYGPCISTGDPLNLGCTCCYIGECFTPACDSGTLHTPTSGAWRVDTFAKRLAGSFKSAAKQDPAAATKFVTFDGCTAHREAVLTLAPFDHPDTLPSPDPGGNFHASDSDPDARYLRGAITLAVRRVLGGIPNGIARWQDISARTWTDAEIAAAVAAVGDADAILQQQLGPFGFQLLVGAEPRHYRLMAVPLPGEPAGSNITPYVAGCVVGLPPTVGIIKSILYECVTAQLEIQDPLAAQMPDGHYPAAVDWGDGRLQQLFVTSPSEPVTHCYDAAGTYTIRAYTVNSAGNVASSETTAEVDAPAGPVDPGPKSVTTIVAELTASTYAHVPPRVRVTAFAVAPDGTAYLLNRLFAPAPARPAGFAADVFPISGTLSHFRATAVSSLKLKADALGGNVVSSAQVLLGQVTLTNWDDSTQVVHPTPNDVQWLPAGASYPVAPLIDLATGALILPSGVEIAVGLPASRAPFAGCRPIYAPGTPAMVTANGGCNDPATGRTWSLGSLPATFAQAQAYCAGLTQGGVSGWRLPTNSELFGVSTAAKAGTFFVFPTNVYAWTSDLWFGATHITRNLAHGGFGVTADSAQATAVCVR